MSSEMTMEQNSILNSEPDSVPLTDQEPKETNETLLPETIKEVLEETKILRTLALIKPDALQANHKEAIVNKIQENGFKIIQERHLQLSKDIVCLFYKEHEGRPFYQDMTDWMSSAPIYAMVLEKEDAVQSWRNLMGPTNSNKARETDPNSIRALFGKDGSHNAAHGSDSLESAEREIDIIFSNENHQVVEDSSLNDKVPREQTETMDGQTPQENTLDETTVLNDLNKNELLEEAKITEPSTTKNIDNVSFEKETCDKASTTTAIIAESPKTENSVEGTSKDDSMIINENNLENILITEQVDKQGQQTCNPEVDNQTKTDLDETEDSNNVMNDTTAKLDNVNNNDIQNSVAPSDENNTIAETNVISSPHGTTETAQETASEPLSSVTEKEEASAKDSIVLQAEITINTPMSLEESAIVASSTEDEHKKDGSNENSVTDHITESDGINADDKRVDTISFDTDSNTSADKASHVTSTAEETATSDVSKSVDKGESLSVEETIVSEPIIEEHEAKEHEAKEHEVEEHEVEEYEVEEHEVEEHEVEKDGIEECESEEREVAESITEEYIVEECKIEEPALKETIVKEPTVEEHEFGDHTTEDAMVEDTMVEDIMVEDALVEDTMVEDTMVEDTIIEDSSVVETVIEDPPTNEAVIEESIVYESAVKEFTVTDSTEEELELGKPNVEELTVEEKVLSKSVFDESTMTKSSVEDSTIEMSTVTEAMEKKKDIVEEEKVSISVNDIEEEKKIIQDNIETIIIEDTGVDEEQQNTEHSSNGNANITDSSGLNDALIIDTDNKSTQDDEPSTNTTLEVSTEAAESTTTKEIVESKGVSEEVNVAEEAKIEETKIEDVKKEETKKEETLVHDNQDNETSYDDTSSIDVDVQAQVVDTKLVNEEETSSEKDVPLENSSESNHDVVIEATAASQECSKLGESETILLQGENEAKEENYPENTESKPDSVSSLSNSPNESLTLSSKSAADSTQHENDTVSSGTVSEDAAIANHSTGTSSSKNSQKGNVEVQEKRKKVANKVQAVNKDAKGQLGRQNKSPTLRSTKDNNKKEPLHGKTTTAKATSRTTLITKKTAPSPAAKRTFPITERKVKDETTEAEQKKASIIRKTVNRLSNAPQQVHASPLKAKKEAPAPATEKPKKRIPTTTISLVSRLTAPTAASARRTNVGTTADTTTRIKKTIDQTNLKKTTQATKRSSLIHATTTAGTTKHHDTKPATARRSSPPSTTTGAAKTVTASIKRTTHITGARPVTVTVPVSSTVKNKTKKETLSNDTMKQKKSTATTREKKKAVPQEKKTASQAEKPNQTAVKEEAQREPVCVPEEINDSDSAETSKESETESEKVHKEQKKEEEIEKDQGTDDSSVDIKVAEAASPKETNDTIPDEEKVSIVVEKEVESVGINEHPVASSEAVVDDKQSVNTTNKPRMASLRSKFENLNSNTNQLQTKEALNSKSPNRISDMINRFTTNK